MRGMTEDRVVGGLKSTLLVWDERDRGMEREVAITPYVHMLRSSDRYWMASRMCAD